MRIGYFVPEFPGQTHILFRREILALEEMGADVRIVSTRPPRRGLISHSWSHEAMARTAYLLPPPARDIVAAAVSPAPFLAAAEAARGDVAAARDILLCAASAVTLKRWARRADVGHVHVHSCGRAALIAALSRRIGGPDYSLTLHGPLEDYGPAQAEKWRGATFATVITRRLLREVGAALGDAAPDRLVVQGMGVDTDKFRRPAPYAPTASGERARIFSCGRLNRVKGHDILVEAIALLTAEGRDVELRIAGEDDLGGQGYRAELERRIAESGMAERVTLLGAVGEDEVRAQLAAAHVFALASLHEPLGVAYMEAMSSATPTVGVDGGGVAELITRDRDGILVPPRDARALANAIGSVLDQPDFARALAKAGRETVVSQRHSRLGAETILREISRSGGPSGEQFPTHRGS